ncbi:MAG: carbamoyl-phosphate synthase large subunit [Fibrobacter sp.]|uniref:carbamoyl-phosphate synthase large subunit n=1 Tax=Fibrobacter sp. UWH5 TaxID=1896211 RepID=UPI0009108791|nr:carbamoyl-phosphate synthase large subunit [Fibrobacter sp. UWH5]MCQ2103817.1 carbamoyl-phosphate synthase large subunit [Fibrobacter sp.]SHK47660.1 carbamoyl-phosphate synthase large subunit [Fibrobacter sp. UWH5]
MKIEGIDKVLIIGSGPIVIGQACEFDYSGTQACKALREQGYKIVLVNSNPATIMTDPVMADATYIEPLNLERLEQIIAKERPQALLPNLGGQTGLNLSSALNKAGILDKYGVKVIGVNLDAIERGEDREIFKATMQQLGIDTPRSGICHSVEEAEKIVAEIGYPVVVRPAYTMGGAGGGFCYNVEELRTICGNGLELSMTHQCLIEESILGWEELEVEVVRDSKNQMIAICFIENIDPVGVHTGDSFCAAPFLTIDKKLEEKLKTDAFKIVEAIGVIGGTNVQFAHDPKTGRVVIIEINPRTSRSSALASKATGFPIALVSAKLAAGMTLDQMDYWRDGTLEKYTPSGDYVVLKFARWAFEKFRGVDDCLGTQMKAVGEVMAIGKTYKETLQKAIRGLENGRAGLGFAKDFNKKTKEELLDMMKTASSERHFQMYEAIRKGATDEEVFAATYEKAYFVQQMRELVELEEKMLKTPGRMPSDELLIQAKKDGFGDKYIAKILGIREKDVRAKRIELGMVEGWCAVPVSGVKDQYYYYSTYNCKDESTATNNPKKIMILGGGPNRIGQGIEFDYCCCHAAMALREMGYETIMVNCNPETVSTDYDTSDKLYFEPVTLEDVLQIYKKEQPAGVIVQFGGQTPLNIARALSDEGVKILGTSIDSIDIAEDRDLFRKMMDQLEIPMPESGMATNIDEALACVKQIGGYPVMIRPSFVLGGRGMEVIYDENMLREYVAKAVGVTPDRPLLIDRFLHNALECEADALSDGEHVYIPSVMEHVELAGVHSGDSACIIPPVTITEANLKTIKDYTRKIAESLHVCGLMNMQYAIEDGKVFVLEANPRASRTVPLVSKVCNTQMARLATRLMMGEKLEDLKLKDKKFKHHGAKEAVFPFDKFPKVDPVLGPEMRSTGEVLGLSEDFALAYYKSQEAAGSILPSSGAVLISLSDKTNLCDQAIEVGQRFQELGFKIYATEGTAKFYEKAGVKCEVVNKIAEGRPNVLDVILNKQVNLIINTPWARRDAVADESAIRKAAIKYKTPYITTLAAALDTVKGIAAAKAGKGEVKSLQEYHASIEEV